MSSGAGGSSCPACHFTAFPSLLRTRGTYLSARGRVVDEAAVDVCRAHPRARWSDASSLLERATEFSFATDGFHPSAEGYRLWAEIIAEAVPDRLVADA